MVEQSSGGVGGGVRGRRPISPHLAVCRPQLTSVLSIDLQARRRGRRFGRGGRICALRAESRCLGRYRARGRHEDEPAFLRARSRTDARDTPDYPGGRMGVRRVRRRSGWQLEPGKRAGEHASRRRAPYASATTIIWCQLQRTTRVADNMGPGRAAGRFPPRSTIASPMASSPFTGPIPVAATTPSGAPSP